MKITQKQAIDLYRVVRKLECQDNDGATALYLFEVRKKLEPRFLFQDEQEKKAIGELECAIDENGIIAFPNTEAKEKYIEKLGELEKLEFELDIDEKRPFNISGYKMSANDIGVISEILPVVCN